MTRRIQNSMNSRLTPVVALLAVLTLVNLVILAGGGLARPVRAQTTANDLRTLVGSADATRLLNEYKGKQAAEGETVAYARRLDQISGRLQTGGAVFLPESEMRDLATRLEKAQPSADDTARIAAIETKAQNLQAEFATLQNTITANDTQKARLAELTETRRKGLDSLGKLNAGYRQQIDDRRDTAGQKIVNEVRAAINKVARQKNLALVLDGSLALYSTNDITGDVLKELNK